MIKTVSSIEVIFTFFAPQRLPHGVHYVKCARRYFWTVATDLLMLTLKHYILLDAVSTGFKYSINSGGV